MHNSVLFTSLFSASTFLSYSALAACTANPDCVALGYTKTSCASGDLVLRCPFNTAKVNCIPKTCETIGKKTCGDICIKAGSCCSDSDCAAGQRCNNNICEDLCGTSPYKVGDVYCNSSRIPIGVVGKISNGGKNGIVVEKNHLTYQKWECGGIDLSCITNMPGSNEGSNPELRASYNGKSNTACMVSNRCSVGTRCNSRNVEGVTGWYLPAAGELYDTMITNGTAVNTGLKKISGSTAIPSSGDGDGYWSSSEYDYDKAWTWSFYFNSWYINNKNPASGFSARCVLAF